MKLNFWVASAFLIPLWVTTPVQAANVQQTRQLLTTKQCVKCDLNNAGLVYANLSRADLREADLSQANLSRANLSGADLSGADLSGASLAGTNLNGANLSGANLTGADLREAYLVGAKLDGANLTGAYLKTAIGLPNNMGQFEDFYRWASEDMHQGKHREAIWNFSRALSLKPDSAQAYLGLAVSRFQLGDPAAGIQDAEQAAKLFSEQGNTQEYESTQKLITAMKEAQNPKGPSGPGFLESLGGLLLQILTFL